MNVLNAAPRYLLFTGKGGVGKTSVACASAVALADQGRRVLLVSTDPASNLDEVLETPIAQQPTPIRGITGLHALNLDPQKAAHAYRERVVGPFRGVLPEASIRSIEEQLSGACTVEIAAFDEFSTLLGDPGATAAFDHILFDTAPTGHTLRLLELPAAWTAYIEHSAGGVSCLGPLSGLATKKDLYLSAREALADGEKTRLVLVARPDASALGEAERTRAELAALGIRAPHLVLNGLFSATDRGDPVALALEARGRRALTTLSEELAHLPRTEFALRSTGLLGLGWLRAFTMAGSKEEGDQPVSPPTTVASDGLDSLMPDLERFGAGVIMTMGKGGVGKTTVAVQIARALARRGRRVHLTTTDPAADIALLGSLEKDGIRVSRIDPAAEVRRYVESTMASAAPGLDEAGQALLREELGSPCTEEVAVFRAFARAVDDGAREFVVIDTAPTGHTVLLLDAAEAYHREVSRSAGHVPEEVRLLLPRLRDPDFARLLIVTLPEATPVHEARQLQDDLARASIVPFAWVVNQSLASLQLSDPVLKARQASEARYFQEVHELSPRVVTVPFELSPTVAPDIAVAPAGVASAVLV